MKKLEDFIEDHSILFLAAIAVAYLGSRVLQLGNIPYYMHKDELETAFRTVSVAHFGYADHAGQFPLYVYAAAFLMKLKGGMFSLKLFRLVSVAAGFTGLVFTYLYILQMTGKRKYGLLGAVLVLTLPVFFVSQRTGIPYYLFLELMPAAFYFLIKGIDSDRKLLYVISSVLFSLTLLADGPALIIVPIFLVVTYIYLLIIKKARAKDLLFFHLIPFAVVMLSVVFTFAPDTGMDPSRFLSNITGLGRLLNDEHPYNASSSFGTLFIFSIPVLIVGCVVSFKKVISTFKEKSYDARVILWIFTFSSLVCTLLSSDGDIPKNSHVFFWATALMCEGLIYISENLRYAYLIEIAAHLFLLLVLGQYYYINFNSELNNSEDHEQGIVVDKSVGEAIKATEAEFGDRNICVITENFDGRNLMVAAYTAASPAEYESFKDKDDFSIGNVSVVSPGDGEAAASDVDISEDGDTVYVINEAEHGDIIEKLTQNGWGAMYVKEYTVCYRQ